MTAHRKLPGSWRRPALLLALAFTLAGCSKILDVENPNNLVEDDLDNPAVAPSIANGALADLGRGIGGMLGPYSTATDEVTWIGSRDAWSQLDLGNLSDPGNEFTNDAFRYFSQGRWMSDEAIRRIKAFDETGTIVDRGDLARAYIYGAISYITIADMFDDFVIASNKRDPGPPVGEANMVKLYDTAIDYLGNAIAQAQQAKRADLETAALGLRARAYYSKALWSKVHPKGQVQVGALINDAQAVADARAALDRMSSDYTYTIALDNGDINVVGEVSLGYNINNRGELQLAPAFFTLSPNKRSVTGVALQDPIDHVPDPVLAAWLTAFQAAAAGALSNMDITVVSAREMHLILAEAALAAGDQAGFTTEINGLRAMDGLSPYSGQIPAASLLEYERRVNLFMQGRRLADLYRFGLKSPEWLPNSPAAQTPGSFFPITCVERSANPNLGGAC